MTDMNLPISTPDLSGLGNLPAPNRAMADKKAAEKVCKDFESVLLTKVLEEMGKTVEKSGLTDDDTSEQVQSLVWMELAQDMANKGGIGLWKQLYKQMEKQMTPAAEPSPSVEQLK